MRDAAIEVATKHCPTCGKDLPKSMFSRQRNKPDGLYYQCKPCARDRVADWQARKRAEMGEAAWLESRAAITRRHRSTAKGQESSRLQTLAYKTAERRLREAHRSEFDALHRIARYELGLAIEDEATT